MTYKNAVDIIKTAIFQSQARAAKALYTIILQNDGQRVIAAFFHACPRALSDVASLYTRRQSIVLYLLLSSSISFYLRNM